MRCICIDVNVYATNARMWYRYIYRIANNYYINYISYIGRSVSADASAAAPIPTRAVSSIAINARVAAISASPANLINQMPANAAIGATNIVTPAVSHSVVVNVPRRAVHRQTTPRTSAASTRNHHSAKSHSAKPHTETKADSAAAAAVQSRNADPNPH